MKVLFIYRNQAMGFSICKVFKPIEEEMKKYADIDSVNLPIANYKPLGLWRNICAAKKAVALKHYDIVHITGTEHYLIPFLKKQKLVVTVHDLGFFTNKKCTIKTVLKYFLWIKSLSSASLVTFISNKSKVEAEKFVKFKSKQAITIYNPVAPNLHFIKKIINIKKPIILHIGTRPNKNLNNTIIALENFPCHLRIIGVLDNETIVLLKKYKIEYSVACSLTDEDIAKEYEKCDIVNFPSFYEGFGMPIIEGQAVGRLVITSNISPMKEVAGKGAVLVDPYNISSIRQGYKQGIKNVYEYITVGLENVKRYNIEYITKEIFNEYKRLHNENNSLHA